MIYTEVLDDGPEVELEFEPVADTLLQAEVADKFVVAYLVQDDSFDMDDVIGDCMGKLYSAHRHVSRDEHRAMQEALALDRYWEPDLDLVDVRRLVDRAADTLTKCNQSVTGYSLDLFLKALAHCEEYFDREEDEYDLDFVLRILNCPEELNYFDSEWTDELRLQLWTEGRENGTVGDCDAVVLDCYDHSGQRWSLSGSGMQCRWDTAKGAGVWIPDDYLREELMKLQGDERRTQAVKYCKQFLKVYNAILSGEVYGCIVQTHDENGEPIEMDSCWGVVGGKFALETLKTDYFDPTCEQIQKQYDEDVRTSCGKQNELSL